MLGCGLAFQFRRPTAQPHGLLWMRLQRFRGGGRRILRRAWIRERRLRIGGNRIGLGLPAAADRRLLERARGHRAARAMLWRTPAVRYECSRPAIHRSTTSLSRTSRPACSALSPGPRGVSSRGPRRTSIWSPQWPGASPGGVALPATQRGLRRARRPRGFLPRPDGSLHGRWRDCRRATGRLLRRLDHPQRDRSLQRRAWKRRLVARSTSATTRDREPCSWRTPVQDARLAVRQGHWRPKDALRGQPRVGADQDPGRHSRGGGDLIAGDRALAGAISGWRLRPTHRARDARLAPHLVDEIAFIDRACSAERLLESLDGGFSPPPGRCRRPTSRSRPCCGRRSWSAGSRRGSWRSSGR